MKIHSRFENYVYPVSLILLNFLLKLFFLDSRDIAMDEPFSIFYSQVDFSTLFNMLKTENHPPFHFLILHYWINLFGISAFSVRFLSLIFSVATVFFIYRIGQKFFSVRAGLIASLIFTFSNYQLIFAHEARSYSLFALLTSISIFLFFAFIYLRNQKKYIYLLILVNTLLIYTHFFGFFVLFIELCSCLIIKEHRKQLLKRYVLILIATFILFLPYFSIFISRFRIASLKGTWLAPPVISDLYNMVWRFSNVPVIAVFFLSILLLALLKYLWKGGRSEFTSSNVKILFTWFFLPYLLMFFVSFKIPMFLDRYVIFISPGFYLLVAISISYLMKPAKWFYIFGLGSVCLMAVTFTPNVDNNRRIREVVEKVKELKKDNSIVYICPEWLDLGFTYYYNNNYFRQYKDYREKLGSENIFPINSAAQMDTNRIRSSSRVIYFEEWATLVDKDTLIYKALSKRFRHHESYKIFESFQVHEFTGSL